MTAEELLHAIGEVDDGLVLEAEKYRTERRPRTWRKPLAGAAAACLVVAALACLPAGMGNGSSGTAESQASASAEDAASGGGSAGSEGVTSIPMEETRITTPEGIYRLTGVQVSQLPEESRRLGILFREGEDCRTGLYTNKKEYAGCMLWAGPDGTRYIQLSSGGYAEALPESAG